MGSRLYADPDKLPGTETGLGQVDDLLDVYPDIYQDLGFGEVHSWDSYTSERISALDIEKVISKIKRLRYDWQRDYELNELFEFLEICEEWCRENNTDISLHIG